MIKTDKGITMSTTEAKHIYNILSKTSEYSLYKQGVNSESCKAIYHIHDSLSEFFNETNNEKIN